MEQNLELSKNQVTEVTTFITTTVLDNPAWDDLVDRLRLCLDTPKGRQFVNSALEKLTLESAPDDLQANVEFLAAPIALKFTDTAVLCHQVMKDFNPLRNKKLINELFNAITHFSSAQHTMDGAASFCHACGQSRMSQELFCKYCGVKFNYPTPESAADPSTSPQQNANAQYNMNAIASLLVTQSQLLSQLTVSKGKAKKHSSRSDLNEDESSDFSDGSPHAIYAVPLWHEGKLSNKELNRVILQFDYPLNTFLKRAATSVAKSLLSIKQARGRALSAEEYEEVTMGLSSAIRDVQEDILQPGGKPAQQDVEALATSLLKSRYTKSALKARCQLQQRRPKAPQPYQPHMPSTTYGDQAQYQDTTKKPYWRPDKKKPQPTAKKSGDKGPEAEDL